MATRINLESLLLVEGWREKVRSRTSLSSRAAALVALAIPSPSGTPHAYKIGTPCQHRARASISMCEQGSLPWLPEACQEPKRPPPRPS